MCGIVYAKNLRDAHPVNDLVKVLYQNQRLRGCQGFGFIGLNAERIDTYRATEERAAMGWLNERQYDEIVFHHRSPTSTGNTLKTTHPFVVAMADRKYYFMHNGVIQNADELRERHSKMGIAYSSEEGDSFNDSEALAWDFCLLLNHKQERISAEGSVAFVCLETDESTNRAERLYFCRNSGASLRIYRDRTLLLIASEGSYPAVRKDRLYFWDYQRRLVRKDRLSIQVPEPFSLSEYGYGYFVGEGDITASIRALEQERDYLLSAGRHADAEAMDEEIEDLTDEISEMRRHKGRTPL